MAKVWFFFEGDERTGGGGPKYELPVNECEEKLDLMRNCFLSENPPKFEDPTGQGSIAGYRVVIVQIDDDEAVSIGWKSGFYSSQLSPTEVIDRLGKPNNPFEIQE